MITVNKHGTIQCHGCMFCFADFADMSAFFKGGVFTHPGTEAVEDDRPGLKQLWGSCPNRHKSFKIADAPRQPTTVGEDIKHLFSAEELG